MTDRALEEIETTLMALALRLIEITGRPMLAELVLKGDGMILIGCMPGTTLTMRTAVGGIVIRDQSPPPVYWPKGRFA